MSWTIYSEDVNTGQRIYVGKTTDLDNKPKVNQETGGFLVCLDDLVNGVYYWYFVVWIQETNSDQSGKDAGEYFGRPNGNTDILNVCKGKVKNRNGHKIHILTAFGFKWKYLKDIEGSTTIEEDGKLYYRP